jgi:hypothetical protein
MNELRKLTLVVAVAAAAWMTAPAAVAAPCAGFTDVDDTVVGASFCRYVEWLKNRAITLGCASTTLYCPNDPVSRLQMAAFMNRLGTALTPVQLRVDTAPGAVDLDTNVVVCQSADFVVTAGTFPRRAYVDVSINGNAPADVGLAADVVMTVDAGANWTNLNTVVNRGFVAANQWGGLSDIGYADLDVGQTVRWGVRMTRGGIAGTTDLADSRCQLRALVYSRDGTVSPF